MRTVSFIVIFSLFSLLLPSCPQLIRAPLHKRPRHKNASKIHNRKLQSFAGSMEITNYQDTQYCATINIGSDNQAFSFALDTGSATMWVPGTYYASGNSGNYFKCSSSSTCKPFANESLSVEYGVGDVAGYKILDQIQLGELTIPQFEMLLVSETLDLSDRNFDGLIGLGSTRDPNTDLPTVIETLTQNNLISVGTFSMYLGFDPSSSGSNTGEIIFGGYDPKYAASDFQFVNVTISDDVVWWQAEIMAVGFGSSQNLTYKANSMIFDSGTSLLLLSEAIFFKFLDAASNQGVTFSYSNYYGSYMCDCNAQSTLDSLTFYFNGATFNLSASDYLYEEDGNCLLAISYQTGVNTIDNPMIFGDTFLSNFYALYTVDNSTVGLAIAVPVSHSSFPVWAIILIVLGSIAIIGLGICCWMRRRKKTQQQERERLIDADAGADDVSYASHAPPTQTNQNYNNDNYQNNQNYYNDNSQNNPNYQNYQNYQNNQSYQNY